MDYSHVIWDFNGTILDDVMTGIISVNQMLAKRGLKILGSKEDYYAVFGFPIKEYYAKLGFDYEKESYDKLAIEWVNLYNENYAYSSLRDGFTECAEYFRQAGASQVVISASELNMLTRQVNDLGVAHYFDGLYGLDNIHAGSKLDVERQWFDSVKPEKAVMIGDTIHDYECAAALGVDCFLICGGHQKRETLEECGCPVFNSYNELIKHLGEL